MEQGPKCWRVVIFLFSHKALGWPFLTHLPLSATPYPLILTLGGIYFGRIFSFLSGDMSNILPHMKIMIYKPVSPPLEVEEDVY